MFEHLSENCPKLVLRCPNIDVVWMMSDGSGGGSDTVLLRILRLLFTKSLRNEEILETDMFEDFEKTYQNGLSVYLSVSICLCARNSK